jgi:hypothetical protein
MTIKAKYLRIGLDHAGIFTGMRVMTGKTITVCHRTVCLFIFKNLAQITMTLKAECGRLVGNREGLGRTGCGVTGTALPFGDRLMGLRLQ